MSQDMDIRQLQPWLGRTTISEDSLCLAQARLLAATLDQPPEALLPGTPLPELWHWIYFREGLRPGQLGPDGHAARGGFLPPVPLPNRMWAGGRLEFHAPLLIGETLRKRSTIASINAKSGRSGKLVFVTIRHEILRGDTCLLKEEQDLVYREGMPAGGDAPRPTHAADTTQVISPDSTLLFRYSALTFNGHRIHYDQDYCRQVEGYGNLVVHGPLNATLMARLAAAATGRPLTSFAYRGLQPVILGSDYSVNARRTDAGMETWIALTDGTLAMVGQAGCQ